MHIRPTLATIDLDAITHNVRHLKAHSGDGCLFMAVVKADAYGHGLIPVAQTSVAAGADWLGVALVEEAIILRRAGIDAPILVLGPVVAEGAAAVVEYRLAAAVSTLDSAAEIDRAALKAGRKATVHVKVDSGMARTGVKPYDAVAMVEKMLAYEHIRIEGIFTHLATSDEEAQRAYSYNQMSKFKGVLETLASKEIHIPLKHAANSGALLDMPDTHLDMVRPGISIYGVYPSGESDPRIALKPAMSVSTRIVFLKTEPAGSKVSYGCTYTTRRPTRIATLPMGYADGFPRLLSNQGHVLVCGQRAPVIGRVCMDMTLIDVTDIPAAVQGSAAVVFGRQGREVILADELAAKCHTIAYEILCGISPRVPRTYQTQRPG